MTQHELQGDKTACISNQPRGYKKQGWLLKCRWFKISPWEKSRPRLDTQSGLIDTKYSLTGLGVHVSCLLTKEVQPSLRDRHIQSSVVLRWPRSHAKKAINLALALFEPRHERGVIDVANTDETVFSLNFFFLSLFLFTKLILLHLVLYL